MKKLLGKVGFHDGAMDIRQYCLRVGTFLYLGGFQSEIMDDETQIPPWGYRLDNFLKKNAEQLGEPDVRLVFRVRAGDSQDAVKRYLSPRSFPATIKVKLGEGTSRENGMLTKQAFEAILGRAQGVFEHNVNPPKLHRGRDIKRLHLRGWDRLAPVPFKEGRILEDILVEMAREQNSIYSVSGAYGPSDRDSNLFEYLKDTFNNCNWALPFPIVEALFKGKEFELKLVYDGIKKDKDSTPPSLDVAERDPLIIVAYNKREYTGGYNPHDETGFKIADKYDVLPVIVIRTSPKISEQEPLVCVPPDLKVGEDLPSCRYEIRATSEGRLYVADYTRFGGRSWSCVGSTGNGQQKVPDDDTAYQIFKTVKKV